MDATSLILRLIHIMAGVLWLGGSVVLVVFIEPTVRALGPDGGKFMQRLVGPSRFAQFMSAISLSTFLASLPLLWLVSGHLNTAWLQTPHGMAIATGGVFGTVAWVLGLTVNGPTAARMSAMGGAIQASGGPPTAEQTQQMAALRTKLRKAGVTNTILLLLAATCMAAARAL